MADFVIEREEGEEEVTPEMIRPLEPIVIHSPPASPDESTLRATLFPSSPRRPNSYLDLALAATQDSVKTLITQGFRSCAYLTDSAAGLILGVYDSFSKRNEEEDSDGQMSPELGPASTTPPEFYQENDRRLQSKGSEQAFQEILKEVEGEHDNNEGQNGNGVYGRGMETPSIFRADSFLTPVAIYRNKFGQSTPRLDALTEKLSGLSPTSWRSNKKSLITENTVVTPLASDNQTGLFEDIEFYLLERADFSFNWTRDVLAYMKQGYHHSDQDEDSFAFRWLKRCPRTARFVSKLQRVFERDSKIGPAWPSRKFIDLDRIDVLSGVGDIVRRQGYQYEEMSVCTNDGYRLKLERIPNHGSNKVLYMQHGVMDSSFTWCCNGADKSLAYLFHDAGYDVFLGNFRGAGVSLGCDRHVRCDISDSEYWDFSINEHAFEDIPTFLTAIVTAKRREALQRNNSNQENVSIVAVAHSMGGAAVLMYLLRQRHLRKPHHLDGLMLLSPAGVHVDAPFYARSLARVLDVSVAKLVNSLRLPDEVMTRLTTKLVHDMRKNLPAVAALMSVAVVNAIGSAEVHPRMGPFSTIQQLTYNLLTCGTSTKVYVHLRQLIVSKRFQAFDYDLTAHPRHFSNKKDGNLEAYGTSTPPEYTSLYNLIDVPVHLIAGQGDHLISPVNILVHHQKMKEAGVDVTLDTFEHCGHADFTIGLNTQVLRGVFHACTKLMGKIQASKKRIQTLKKNRFLSGPR